MYRLYVILALLLCCKGGKAQDLDSLMAAMDTPRQHEPVQYTFKAARLVNVATVQQLKARGLEFILAHRFGDLGGEAGGYQTFYGIDNVRDVRLALAYGISDRWTVGIGRSKGAFMRRAIVDLNSKVRLVEQRTGNGSPFSLSLYGAAEVSTMRSSSDTLSIAYYRKPVHRVNYVAQALIARKFSPRFSLLLAPTLVYRNLVLYSQKNALFALAGGFRFLLTKRIGIIADYCYVFDKQAVVTGFHAPLGVGFEFETGGHVFHLVFSNTPALLESQYMTETTDSWIKGQVRFGFNLSRVFTFTK